MKSRESSWGILDHEAINELFIRKPEREILEGAGIRGSGRQAFQDGPGRHRSRPGRPPGLENRKRDQDAEKEHEAQMRTYLKIIREIYPGRTP